MTTSKTLKMKKCPISRANIIHFETLALYQNVSYKMAGVAGIEPAIMVLETIAIPFNYTPVRIVL